MAGAVLLRAGRHLRWVGTEGPLGPDLLLGPDPEEAARATAAPELRLPAAVAERVARSRPRDPVAAADPGLRGPELGRLDLAETARRRAARERGWPALTPADREFYLALARRRLEELLEDPVEILVSLAREEERLERARRKEESAAEHFLAPAHGALEEYRASWEGFRTELSRHHARLEEELARQAREVAPNLAHLVGAKVAARLIAQAGGRAALARLNSSKLQLLGSRRRPGPGRTPRYGLIFRADGMDRVPAARQGAYARSLAALAALAARLDEVRPVDRSERLLQRRDRRIRELARGRG